MRYIAQDKDSFYLKCRHCKKIFTYDRNEFKKEERSKCPNCGKGGRIIWLYPIKVPKIFMSFPFLIMTVLSTVILFIICFPFFQKSYSFNKSVTALNPLFTSILISAACSFLSLDFSPKLYAKSGEQNGRAENIKRGDLVIVVVECITLILAMNIIMETQYCPLEINNSSTGEMQQYFGNATGEFASGMGRLFNSQGELVYIGGFKNNLFDGYGKEFELINTVHNTEVSQSYQCVYEGFYKDGLPDGQGCEYRYDAEYTFEKGEDVDPNLYYEGQFVEGEYCGYGTLYGIESKYEGVFFGGEYNGYGNEWFLDSSNKKIYKIAGTYLNGSINGPGKKYYPDGTILFDGTYESGKSVEGTSYFSGGGVRYIGEWDGNNYNGRGTLYWQNGNTRFDGDWVDDKKSGSGTSYREDGTIEYIGGWQDDQYSGYGKLYYEDGMTLQYDGRFNNGVKNGTGTKYYRDGTPQYSGNWSSGSWNGQGTWFWENGEKYYEGDFASGKPNGLGTIYLESGTINYEGNCENGYRSGYGISYDNTGIKNYEGDFLDDEWNGQGISYWPNGKIKYEGNWQAGSYSGEGREYDADGNLLYEGIFDNGEFISSLMD
ncbi:MAG: hypothetical protein HDQ96_06970 [Lachnospiraceae bacterium]|nr:hypothetical protein [Lachnospiraceae bacterium]